MFCVVLLFENSIPVTASEMSYLEEHHMAKTTTVRKALSQGDDECHEYILQYKYECLDPGCDFNMWCDESVTREAHSGHSAYDDLGHEGSSHIHRYKLHCDVCGKPYITISIICQYESTGVHYTP